MNELVINVSKTEAVYENVSPIKFSLKRLGTKVYCLYKGSIIVNHVGYIGGDGFIIQEYSDDLMPDSVRWFWEDYEETWFTSLTKAKKRLLAEMTKDGKKGKVVQIADDYYEFKTMEELAE